MRLERSERQPGLGGRRSPIKRESRRIPYNLPSRRTCEIIRAQYVDTVPLPETTDMYRMGDRLKCRYRLDL